MKQLKEFAAMTMAVLLTVMMVAPTRSFAANHREAPITALDRLADVTDYFSFVSYDDRRRPDKLRWAAWRIEGR